MPNPIAMHIPSLKEVVSADEGQLRVDLAANYRLVAAYGMSDLVFTHIVGQGSALAWPALLRKLERMDPCYKD